MFKPSATERTHTVDDNHKQGFRKGCNRVPGVFQSCLRVGSNLANQVGSGWARVTRPDPIQPVRFKTQGSVMTRQEP